MGGGCHNQLGEDDDLVASRYAYYREGKAVHAFLLLLQPVLGSLITTHCRFSLGRTGTSLSAGHSKSGCPVHFKSFFA